MKVGDYVRTKKGTIYQFNSTSSKALSGAKKYMVKSSPNIIDLIEEGDYVNGHKVIYTIGNINKRIYVEYVNMDELLEIKLEQIKSIATKEQFEAIQYEVK